MKNTPKTSPYSLTALPNLQFSHSDPDPAPDEAECMALWKKYAMLDNIQRHSRFVADIATSIAEKAVSAGMDVSVPHVRASALLHDLAKTYTIKYGGSHAQLGACWVVAETRAYGIAQGILHHVCWPWEVNENNICSLPFFVIYADKRVRHDIAVPLNERFSDLLTRYGHSEASRAGIKASHEQGRLIESLLSEKIGVNLNECSFDRGRLVP